MPKITSRSVHAVRSMGEIGHTAMQTAGDFPTLLRTSRRVHKTVMPVLDTAVVFPDNENTNRSVVIKTKGISGKLSIRPRFDATNNETRLAVNCYQEMFGNESLSAKIVQDIREPEEKHKMYRNADFQKREATVCRPLYRYLDMGDHVELERALTTMKPSSTSFQMAEAFLLDRVDCKKRQDIIYGLAKSPQRNWEALNNIVDKSQLSCPFPKSKVIPEFMPKRQKMVKNRPNDEGGRTPMLGGDYTWEEIGGNIF